MKQLLVALSTLVVLFIMNTTIAVAAVTNTWLGTNGTAWGDPTNWDRGSVPTSGEDVVINAGAVNAPIISDATGTARCRKLTIGAGATLAQTGGVLEVNRDWNNISGFFSPSIGFQATGGTVRFVASGNGTFDAGHNRFFHLIVDADPKFDNSASSNLFIAGNYTNSITTLNTTQGTFHFNGSADQTIFSASDLGKATFGNLSIEKTGGTATIISPRVQVEGQITITGGILDVGANVLSRTGTAGSLTVHDGTTLKLGGTNTMFNTFTPRIFEPTSTVEYNGAAQVVGAETYGNLIINGTDDKTLGGATTVNGMLTLTSGKLILGANNLTIASTGSTSADADTTGQPRTSYIVTDGSGVLTRNDVGANKRFPIGPTTSAYNPVTINNVGTSDNFSARVQVGFGSLPGGAPGPIDVNLVVNRAWVVTEGTPGGSNATLTFQYNSGEFNSVTFDVTNNYIARHNGTQWMPTTATETYPIGGPFTSAASGFNAFSPFGITSNLHSLPIQLASFTGTVIRNNRVRLDWRTISEINNYGFYVQKRSIGATEWTAIDNSFVPGHGTTNEPQVYSYVDNALFISATQYRLKQVDLDGTINFTEPITVDNPTSVAEAAPVQFALMQNYPNPFNPSTEIKFSVETTGNATLDVYNSLGEKVAALFDNVAQSGQYYKVRFDAGGLSTGVYYYRLQSAGKVSVKRLLLLR